MKNPKTKKKLWKETRAATTAIVVEKNWIILINSLVAHKWCGQQKSTHY